MKCEKCGGVAVIGMPQHRLNLCSEHFQEWVPRTVQRTIEKHSMFGPKDRILVAVSGGKDSLGLWEILINLGYQTEGIHINLGIDHESYSDNSQAHVEAFAVRYGHVPFRVVNVRQSYGRAIPDLARTRRGQRACSVCGLVKRHIMNQMAYEGNYTAIATGHNLDDEAAILMQNTLRWQEGYLRRQAPVLQQTASGLARKVKPLCLLYERETAAYALLRNIEFVDQECPFSLKAKTIFYKQLLNTLEHESPGAKLQFYLTFLQAKEKGLFSQELPEQPGTCLRCGQPTLAGDMCTFCRLWEHAS
jgi:uncharacterized protein (TIGR00269 family)